ncbi:tetratricopeptide repeat-containing sensor histidine kinase [Hymenobacter cellulosilyticus]|uniref:histidine kinase n=1 Tax=Hymenobacter cellulosilyticus TaxID=2932248 RepID=A0A8T9Q7R4_9BACT|nr:ATP-binding protein [Hymenobacter cellulosilyticus]UOQ71820.1 ATP-binding protein [Hymenobacter cellulosilyticus]
MYSCFRCLRTLLLLFLLVAGSSRPAFGQSPALDSLRRLAAQPQPDTSRVLLFCAISDQYWVLRTDSAEAYSRRALALARQTRYVHGEGEALNRLGAALRERNLARALELFQESLQLAEAHHDLRLQAQNLRSIGIIYVYLRDRQQGLSYYFQALRIGEKLHDERRMVIELSNIGLAYDLYNQVDSASYYQERAYALAQRLHSPTNYILYGLGQVARKRGQLAQARRYYQRSIVESAALGHQRSSNFAYVGLATLYQQQGRLDSSIYYARLGSQAAQRNGFLRGVLNASALLTQDFKTRGPADSALKYQTLLLAMKDTLFGQEKVMRLQNINYQARQREQKAAADQAALVARYRTYGLIGLLAGLLVLVGLLVRHYRVQQRANAALQASLAELKTAQFQLVQREKMAFLGELTAGVAHELQNPLSFVKKFAEVSTDLVDEINGAQRLARDGQLEREILDGLKQNIMNISTHGQRATAIIKGMLEHARTGSAPREATDLNSLIEENLRLAYQAAQNQHPGFEATLTRQLAPTLPAVAVVAPDLGRVLLNLCTNALYAVRQRQEQEPSGRYAPAVTVSSQQLATAVEIRVGDNGVGISADVRAKIFQPFFTTKPVGEGTGLGLSLSHDIISTGHGGQLSVESREGEGTTFIITLPLTTV